MDDRKRPPQLVGLILMIFLNKLEQSGRIEMSAPKVKYLKDADGNPDDLYVFMKDLNKP